MLLGFVIKPVLICFVSSYLLVSVVGSGENVSSDPVNPK